MLPRTTAAATVAAAGVGPATCSRPSSSASAWSPSWSICFLIGAWAVVALATAVVVLATAEFFTATRRSGYHPAPLIGLAGSGGMVLAAYLAG